ncbi:MAG: hypothetical protein FJ125_17990, partial [Deltaproteobacteria bacterium]|nr:hypothetical protein [Deltaproteobacteria bacterium]
MSQPTPQEEGESQVLDEAGRSTALVDVSTESLLDCSLFTLHDLEAIRSLLRGGSVVDWRRSNFGTLAEVDSFLRVSGFDPERPKDRVRLHTLHRQAVVYLKENLHFAFPEELSHPESVAGLFLVASDRKSQNP